MISLKKIFQVNIAIFSLIFILHFVRIAQAWILQIDNYLIPRGLSLIILAVMGYTIYANYKHYQKLK